MSWDDYLEFYDEQFTLHYRDRREIVSEEQITDFYQFGMAALYDLWVEHNDIPAAEMKTQILMLFPLSTILN